MFLYVKTHHKIIININKDNKDRYTIIINKKFVYKK